MRRVIDPKAEAASTASMTTRAPRAINQWRQLRLR